MFDIGDRIMCVDDEYGNVSLTIGKEYIIKEISISGFIRVINDNEILSGYFPKRFILSSKKKSNRSCYKNVQKR